MAESMEVRICRRRRPAGLTWWAVVLSLAAHSLLLGSLIFIKVTAVKKDMLIVHTPNINVTQVKKIIDSPLIMPKPKVVTEPALKPLNSGPDKVGNKLLLLPTPLLRSSTPQSLTKLTCKDSAGSSPVRAVGSSQPVPARVEFFGSAGGERKVCFVVDCSGSMQGLFSEVVQKLKASVGNLQADQYFYIIFFAGDNLLESGAGELVRATSSSKAKAYSLMDTVRPAGPTNALAALRRAMKIRSRRGETPELIYFLTDGFELSPDDIRDFADTVAKMRKHLAPRTKINTIGFWTQPDDCKTLQAIAAESGGQFVRVGG